jgi:hypothetical protein
MTDHLAELSDRGVSIWLDDLSRQRLSTGSLAGLVARDHVVGELVRHFQDEGRPADVTLRRPGTVRPGKTRMRS